MSFYLNTSIINCAYCNVSH